MKRKLAVFLLLDLILALLFTLMFNKFAINLQFHEIGGFVFLGCGIIHLIIHPKYIINLTKNLFSDKTSGKARFNYIINFIMLIVLVMLFLNSIHISTIVLDKVATPFEIDMHKFLSALFLLLASVHLGLHFNMLSQKLKLNHSIAMVIIVFTLGFGGYSLLTTNYISYITAPFVETVIESGVRGQGRGKGKNRNPENHHEGEEEKSAFDSIQWSYAGKTIIEYASIMYSFCFVTHLIEISIKKKKEKGKVKRVCKLNP